ncbi:MAG: hypothetical protein ACT4RN_03170 [Pseudonocardia sp.]
MAVAGNREPTGLAVHRKLLLSRHRVGPVELDLSRMTRLRLMWRPHWVELDAEGLMIEPVIVFRLIEFYLRNPQLRGELGTQVSIERVRRRDLPATGPGRPTDGVGSAIF